MSLLGTATVRYTTSVEIDLPRAQMLSLLADPALMPSWLRGLVLREPLTGAHGEVGTTSRVVFQTGKHRMEATETITRLEPTDLQSVPTSVVVHDDREIAAERMWQAQRDQLVHVGPSRTRWDSESEFRLDGVVMRLVGLLMPGSFRKQSRQHMLDFKAFAEHGRDVRHDTD